jgi:hypothetical protein
MDKPVDIEAVIKRLNNAPDPNDGVPLYVALYWFLLLVLLFHAY